MMKILHGKFFVWSSYINENRKLKLVRTNILVMALDLMVKELLHTLVLDLLTM